MFFGSFDFWTEPSKISAQGSADESALFSATSLRWPTFLEDSSAGNFPGYARLSVCHEQLPCLLERKILLLHLLCVAEL